MRLTAKQLRRIIAEEVAKLTQIDPKLTRTSFLGGIGGLGGRGGADMGPAPGEESKLTNDEEESILNALAARDALSSDPEPDSPLRMTNSYRRRGKRIAEGHARITEEEVVAWKNGDWGFNSQQDSTTSKLDDHERFLHGSESGHPMDDEGYMVKSRMTSMKNMATDIHELLDGEDQLPGWVQDLIASSHSDMQHVHDYLMGDEEMRSNTMSPVQQKMPVGEGRFRRRTKRLSEGHARITQEEMTAWKNGDWGFISETESDLMRDQPEDGGSMQISSQINRLRRRDK